MSKALLFLAFTVLLIVIGPIATIWALNTLFPALNIQLGFDTWLAVAVITAVFKTTISKKD
jgi:membrane protein implicated in regulation of membrane protease activity